MRSTTMAVSDKEAFSSLGRSDGSQPARLAWAALCWGRVGRRSASSGGREASEGYGPITGVVLFSDAR
jgi:hypothetical protein